MKKLMMTKTIHNAPPFAEHNEIRPFDGSVYVAWLHANYTTTKISKTTNWKNHQGGGIGVFLLFIVFHQFSVGKNRSQNHKKPHSNRENENNNRTTMTPSIAKKGPKSQKRLQNRTHQKNQTIMQ
jgi:hypothetical protein